MEASHRGVIARSESDPAWILTIPMFVGAARVSAENIAARRWLLKRRRTPLVGTGNHSTNINVRIAGLDIYHLTSAVT